MHVVLFTLCVHMLLGKYRYVCMYANTVHDTRQMQMQGSSRVDTTDYTVQLIQ